jgi:hypothetical protein
VTSYQGGIVGYPPVGRSGQPVFRSPEGDPVGRILDNNLQLVLRFLRAQQLDEEAAALLTPARVSLRVVSRARVQAATVRAGERHLIVVNAGMAMLLYRLARVFSRHIIVRGPSDPPAPDPNDSKRLIGTMLGWMASMVGAPLMSQEWPVTDRERGTAENFATAAERFIICHELAHVVLHDRVATIPNEELPGKSLEEYDYDARSTTEESMADRWATRVVVDSMVADGLDVRAAAVGVHYALEALTVAEQVGAIPPDRNHPPAEHRLLACSSALEDRFGARFDYVYSWAIELNQLMVTLLGGAYLLAGKPHDLGYKVAKANMDFMFDHASWPPPPRESTNPRVDPVEVFGHFLKESPSAVLESMSANLLDLDQYAAKVPPGSRPDEDNNDAWRRHQIASSLAARLPNQARAALGFPT